MTLAHNSDWVTTSLAQLERLSEERDAHERALETTTDTEQLRLHMRNIEQTEAAIAELYEQLEDFERSSQSPSLAAKPETPRFTNPADFAPHSNAGSLEDAADFDDLPVPPRSSRAFALGGAVLAAVVVAAFYGLAPAKPAPAPASPQTVQVISAPVVQPDTQEPKVAKGSEVSKTAETPVRGGASAGRGAGNIGGGAGNGGGRNPSQTSQDNGRKIAIDKSGDPLAGLH